MTISHPGGGTSASKQLDAKKAVARSTLAHPEVGQLLTRLLKLVTDKLTQRGYSHSDFELVEHVFSAGTTAIASAVCRMDDSSTGCRYVLGASFQACCGAESFGRIVGSFCLHEVTENARLDIHVPRSGVDYPFLEVRPFQAWQTRGKCENELGQLLHAHLQSACSAVFELGYDTQLNAFLARLESALEP